MTENKAIKWLREMQNPMMSEAELYCAETCYGSGKMVYPEPEDYVFETAIQALEEIQRYRAIGTIEEFKDLKEKGVAKKAEVNEFDYGEGYVCGECESFLHYVDDDDEHIRTNYCCHCGTKIDWQ